jgi:hypothetical protein
MHRIAYWVAVLSVGVLLGACSSEQPTITPAPDAPAEQGSTSIVMTIEAPSGAGAAVIEIEVPGITIPATAPYRDAEGAFSMDIPLGWPEDRQPVGEADIRLGTIFQPPARNALISVTQFDNGQVPGSLGATANDVMRKSGVLDQPNYLELGRETVIEREEDALRVELAYSRSDGVDMHSLVLFQIDGTTFSMVHVGVEEGSWAENEGVIRDILATYRVPAESG